MKKSLSWLSVLSLTLTGLVAIAPAASAAPQDNIRFSSVNETRALTNNTNFQAESDERSVLVSAEITMSSAQYAAVGSGKNVTIKLMIKNGTALVARESSVSVQGAITNYSWGTNTFLTNSNTGDVTFYANAEANLLPATNYQVSVEVLVDGTAISVGTTGSTYSITSISGTFSKTGKSVTAAGDEGRVEFRGRTCVSEAGYASLSAGDVLQVRYSDTASTVYAAYSYLYSGNTGSPSYFSLNNTSQAYEVTLTQQMLTDKFYVESSMTKTTPAAGLLDPTISLKESGSAVELSEACATAPSAPTLTATVTGLSMAVDTAGTSGINCYIADARYPNLYISRSFASAPQASCLFTGLKQGNYVGYAQKVVRLSQMGGQELLSDVSPASASVAYAGGNSSYRTYSGTTGGTGQGSLSLTNIDYVGSDFGTERRVSDGNGGMLVGSIEGPDNTYKIRQLTPSGMSTTFGQSGVVNVSLPPVNIRTASQNFGGSSLSLGWFGASRDKWVFLMPNPSAQRDDYGYESSARTLSFGDYAGTSQTDAIVSTTDIARFCQLNISGADNRVDYATLGQIISAPTADPLLIVNCNIRHGNTGYMTSTVPFLATYSGGQFVLKAKLGEEPSSTEKCSATVISAVNSGATGSEVMLATLQRTWNPATTDCYSWSTAVTSASVVSRDVFTVTSGYARTQVQDVMTTTATDEPGLNTGGMSNSSTTRLIVSGPNTHALISEVTGQFPTQTTKYKVARLTNGSFGSYESMPYLKVNSTESFASGTNFSQIADYSENVAGSVLISRSDLSTGTTAARADLSTGELTSYQQMASSQTGFGMTDGGSLILGNSSGALNFYGITSRTTAVLGQWVTTGAFDPALAALPINQGAGNTGVTQGGPGAPPQNIPAGPAAAPYTGPVVKAPGTARTLVRGSKLTLEGSNLTGVTKVTVDGKDAKVKVNSAGELEIVVPSDLPNGTYDLVITSSSGELTVQDAIRVANSASILASNVLPSTKLKEDNTVKVWVFDVAGSGKVQIFLNGEEIAWVNTSDPQDSKLTNGYLVRTLDLLDGKNVIEVFVDGKRVDRKAYTKVDDDSKI